MDMKPLETLMASPLGPAVVGGMCGVIGQIFVTGHLAPKRAKEMQTNQIKADDLRREKDRGLEREKHRLEIIKIRYQQFVAAADRLMEAVGVAEKACLDALTRTEEVSAEKLAADITTAKSRLREIELLSLRHSWLFGASATDAISEFIKAAERQIWQRGSTDGITNSQWDDEIRASLSEKRIPLTIAISKASREFDTASYEPGPSTELSIA